MDTIDKLPDSYFNVVFGLHRGRGRGRLSGTVAFLGSLMFLQVGVDFGLHFSLEC